MIYLNNYYLLIIVINFILFKSTFGKIGPEVIDYKDTDEFVFHKDRKVNDIFELLCKEENDSNLCPEHEIQTATCKNKNYQLKRLPNFHCIYENLKEDVSVKDYDIKCKEFNRFSYYKDTCSLVYILQYKKTNDKDDEQNKKTDPLVYFIYILGLLSGLLLLSVIAYISYKQMRKYRTRRFSVYPD